MKNPLNPPLHGGQYLKVKSGAKTARFVVDLKKNLPKEAVAVVSGSRLEKLAEVDYGKMYEKGKEKTKSLARSFWIPCLAGRQAACAGMTKKRKWIPGQVRNGKNPLNPPLQGGRIIDQLAFAELGKLLFLGAEKICYAAGWLIMFAIRLVYLIAKGFAKKFWIPAFAGMTKKNEIASLPPVARNDNTIGYLKPVLVFAGVLLIIILPVKAFSYYKSLDTIKGRVLGASESAMDDLLAAGQNAASFDFDQAEKSFSQAGANFLQAQNQLNEINGLLLALAALAPDKNIRLAAVARNILKAGELSSAAGKNLSLVMSGLLNYQAASPAEILKNISINGHKAINNLNGLSRELEQIDAAALPQEYQQQFIILKQKIRSLKQGLALFTGLAEQAEIFLGAKEAKRYLLVFQNNAELRASGGFLGSFALLDLLNGKIKKIEVPAGGSYDTEAGFLKKIKSPQPLSLIRPDWHFWDANWWPDWPKSAQKLAWFYEQSGGSTVDGVIGFTPTVMEKILKIIGPLDLTKEYGLVINSENFWLETQKLAEQKPGLTKQPKKIIGDLMNRLVEEIPRRLNKNNLAGLINVFLESAEDKNILFYLTDGELAAKAGELGLDGKIKDSAGDYLSVVNTNIAGGKSDRQIDQQISLVSQVQSGGSIINNLTVKRTHNGNKGEPFSAVRNVNWLRIYAPLGSVLLEASGFKPVDKIFFKQTEAVWQDDPMLAAENQALTDQATGTKIYNEFNKTVFANWSQLDPGETIEISLKYRLPFKLTDKKSNPEQTVLGSLLDQASAIINPEQADLYSYTLLAQKQPGMNSSTFLSQLKLSDNFRVIWQSNSLSGSQLFASDISIAALAEEK